MVFDAALRQVLSYYPFHGDYKALARMTVPEITPAEAQKGVEVLCGLEFVLNNSPTVHIKVLDRFLSTATSWHSIAVRRCSTRHHNARAQGP